MAVMLFVGICLFLLASWIVLSVVSFLRATPDERHRYLTILAEEGQKR
jgi:hypothetical protein